MKIKQIRSGSKNRSAFLLIGTALVVFLVTLTILYAVDPAGHSSRQDALPNGGAGVAPVDPERTVSLFQIFVDGGLQEVRARDESDQKQVASIRAHLHDRARKFSSGDFSDAAGLHSEEMAWLADLKAGTEEIDVHYKDLSNGAQIRYVTGNPKLVSALHRWLMAGVSDRERPIPTR